MQPRPPVTTDTTGADQFATQARLELAELRPAHEEDHVDAGHPAAQVIGRLELPDQVAEHHAHGVGAPVDRQAPNVSQKLVRQPERHRGDAVADHRRDQHPAAPLDVSTAAP